MDVLTIQQLKQQLQRRQAWLDALIAQNAPKSVIEAAQKQLMLTRRRIERMQVADYEESPCTVKQMGGDTS